MAHLVRFRDSIFGLLLLVSCSNLKTSDKPVFNAAEVNVHLLNGLLMENDKPFTGTIYTQQANQRDTAEIVSFREGREDGVWKKFYPSGKLMEKRKFSNGKKTGAFYAWWPNGALKLDYYFENGEYEGLCREWNEQGMLVKEMNYKSGYENGSQKLFYTDGKIKANYVIIDGRRYGLLGTKNCVNVTNSVFKD